MAPPRDRAQYTHAGRRAGNQDATIAHPLADDRELLAVADGMGGHQAGEVASARTLEVLVAEVEAGADLRQAVRAANRAVYTQAARSPEHQGMGTTLVALLLGEIGYEIANVGDSRAYRIDAEEIRQLTLDHSFAAEAVRAGSMSAEEAAASPWRNALTRAVGTDPEVEIDLFGPFPADASHVVLLCSDGLYKAVPEEIIREYVLATEDLETAVHSLAALAFRNGSDDNITAAALEFGTLGRRPATITLPVAIQRQRGRPAKARSRAPAARPPVERATPSTPTPPSPRPAAPSPAPRSTKAPGNVERPPAYTKIALILLLLAVLFGFLWSLLLA